VLTGVHASYTVEYPCHAPDEDRWFRLSARTVAIGGRRRLVVIHEDVSDRKQLQDDVRARSLLLDEVDAAVIATDLAGVVTMWNRAAERIYGWSAEEAVGQPAVPLAASETWELRGPDVVDQLVERGSWEGDMVAVRKDGSTFPTYVRNTLVRDQDGSPTGVVSVSVDLSVRIAMQEQLARSNRELKAITNSIGDGLCTLDSDGRITYVNPAAQRLMGVYVTEVLGVRFTTWLRVANPGSGDSPADMDPDQPVECLLVHSDGAESPIEYIATPLIATNDTDPSGWVVVFRDITDRRERETKMAGQVEQATWLGRIRDALDTDGFVLYVQPIVDLRSGEVIQNELLIRMRDPDDPDDPDAIIPPGMFLPVAEELGLAPLIDRWVLRNGLTLAATGLPVQINLSATSLDDPTLPHLVEQLLEETGADPTTIMFEITETALLASDVNAARFAEHMHRLGCRLALDDFGTGYGGFTYLKQLPIDELKIDIEFVRDATIDPASRLVIDAVVSLARAFGLRTVGEGVEDQATLDLLKELGVDSAQGYFLGRPGPIDRARRRTGLEEYAYGRSA
jgi:PAS domain S-box-containing protein